MEIPNRKQMTIKELRRVQKEINDWIENCEIHLANAKSASEFFCLVKDVKRTDLYMFKLTIGLLMEAVAEVIQHTAKFSDLQNELNGWENDDEN